jgi:hypothetical protein
MSSEQKNKNFSILNESDSDNEPITKTDSKLKVKSKNKIDSKADSKSDNNIVQKQDRPKRKPNHFFIFNKTEQKLEEVKYLSQKELSEGWRQVMPRMHNRKLLNNFSITLCFLPDYLWSSLYKFKNNEGDYIINDGARTRYTIIETNQDDIMINLYNELKKVRPDNETLLSYINDLDESQHNSWLVLRAKTFIKHGYFCKPHYVTRETLGL